MVETIIIAETIVSSIVWRIDINQFHAITKTLAERIERKQVVTFDDEIIDRIYKPFDSLTLMVSLKPDGGTDREVIASLAGGLKASPAWEEDWGKLKAVFEAPSLQMVSFTITEKGYALRDMKGELFPVVREDLRNGPETAGRRCSFCKP